jgi:hypothetical protein
VNTVFDGGSADAIVIVGDGGDPNRFVEDGNVNEQALGVYIGTGVGIDNAHLFTAADTIDVGFTADTNADGSTGAIDWTIAVARIDI